MPARADAAGVGRGVGTCNGVDYELDVRCAMVTHRAGIRELAPAEPHQASMPEVFLSDPTSTSGSALLALAIRDNRRATADRFFIDVCMAPFENIPTELELGAYTGTHAQVVIRRERVVITSCQADNGADISVIDRRLLQDKFPTVK